jgi:glycosyltransferase involved in cell wall biosynthesis
LPKLWIFTSRFPYPIEKGDKLRLYFQLKELSRHFDITLFTLCESKPESEHIAELKAYCSDIIYEKSHLPARLWHTFLSFAHQLPLQVGYFKNNSLKGKINEMTILDPPDVIYCHLIRMSEYVRHLPVPKVLDYMDAFSLGMFRAAENSRNVFWKQLYKIEAVLCEQYERSIFHAFNGYTIISRQDRDALHIFQKRKITIVQNGIDIEQFYFEEDMRHHKQVVFIGNLGYAPNVRAVQYLVEKVMPLIWEKHPDTKLMIAGARPHRYIKQLDDPRIEMRGWVEDIREAYSEGSVFAAPLFTGSGMQNKILEAMSVGLPCVTTSIVNNSILAKEGEEILIADSSRQFVDHISRLFEEKDQFECIRRAGRAFIEQNYPWDKATRPLIDLLQKQIE